jgi:glyoxylase-like metal-dependent hydrolase (beta-lactamase superfamily II)
MTKVEVKSFFDHTTATWSYIVFDKNGENKNCAIIDSVLDYDINSGKTSTKSADLLINFIKENNLNLEWILETHVHADHLTAAKYLKEKLGGKTAISNRIIAVLKTWQEIFHNEEDTPLNGKQFDYLFEDNEEFMIGDLKAKIIATPGHTPADTSYIIEDSIFVGDSIFLPDVGTGRCDFPNGSATDSYDSIQKLFSFPDNYKIYVGHDYPPSNLRKEQSFTTIKEQKERNIRVHQGISKDEYISKRNKDDVGKAVPKLLFPSLQVNLRAGDFGKNTNGVQYIKIPVNVF